MFVMEMIWVFIVLIASLYLGNQGVSTLTEWGHRSVDDDPSFPWLGMLDVSLGAFCIILSVIGFVRLLS